MSGGGMRTYLTRAAWTLLAGAGIPLIGTLNSGVARSVGNPFTATAIVFLIGFAVASAIALPLFGAPTGAQLAGAPPIGYAAGLLMSFYVLSATLVIPRMGAASFVAFILIAQLFTSAVVDQFRLFGLTRRPVDALRLAGLAVIVGGIAILEYANLRRAHP